MPAVSAAPQLGELYFGEAAAENEVADNAERFLDTYVDNWSLKAAIETHKRFLILGPKGTGKSAAAHYVRLAWTRDLGEHAVFSTFVDFDELNRTQSPLVALDRKLVGDVPALTDAAWRLFISVRLLDSLLRDNACPLSRDTQVLNLNSRLRSSGLASDDYPQVLRQVRERTRTITVPRLADFSSDTRDSDIVPVSQLGDALLRLITSAVTPNRHILAIDGLDKAIGDNSAYWQTLAALVRVTDSLTRELRVTNTTHLYTLVMCRSDVFRRVRFADAAKIAADGAIHMDWGAEAEDPQDVRLWDYIARKARTDVTELLAHFPPVIRVGTGQKVPLDRYLLQFTRYTPRDMTLLFNTFRSIRPKGVLSNSNVRRAVDTFSSRHLLTEMMSEAHGLLNEELIDRFETILGSLPGRIIERVALERAIAECGISDPNAVDEFGEYLFLQGAIGNYRATAGYVQFYHRRDSYKWQKSGPWVLHTGLIYAFNIPWSNTPVGGSVGPASSSTRRPRNRRRKRAEPSE